MTLPNRRTVLPLLALVLAFAALVPALAQADSNGNSYDCRGHIAAGKPLLTDDPADTAVQYTFACNGPILGYQIQPQISDTAFGTDAIVLDRTTGNAVLTDSFTCDGDFPGYGINCIGVYSGDYANVIGQFSIATKLCAEPRVDPLLTVVYATADSKGKVTQYISGPFDLGRPRGCPKSALGGKTRIPSDAELAAPTTKKPAAKKPATKRKLAAKRA